MRENFPGYFKLSEKEITNLWNKAIFTFDANILLNLYRYSDETREEFFKVLKKIKERIWITHQSAQEFFENRLNVINQQEKSYKDAISTLHSIETEFKKTRQHPFIDNNLLNKFSSLNKDICKELNKSKEFHNRRITDDHILSRIESLFDNKVGSEFSVEALDLIFKKGEVRFTNKIPPGFKDSGKKDNEVNNNRKYGDFIVWKQILEKSKESKQAVILVTDDRKEDWWVRFKGKTVNPRPELIKEFKDFTSQSFHMYQSDRFLEFAKEYFDEAINERAIEEIRELRKLDERRRLSEIRKERERLRFKEFRDGIIKERIILEEELDSLNIARNRIIDELGAQEYQLLNSNLNASDDRRMQELHRKLLRVERNIKILLQKRDKLQQGEVLHRNRIRNSKL